MRGIALAITAYAAAMAGYASAAPPAGVRLDSQPPGALVTLVPDNPADRSRTVLGLTPIDASIAPNTAAVHLVIEKRGFAAATLPVNEARPTISVQLQPTGGPTEVDPAVAGASSMVLVGPDIEVIRRGFSKETISEEDSAAADDALAAAVESLLGPRLRVHRLPIGEAPVAFLRDAKASARTLDPVRLPFLAAAPRLETAAGRRAAATLGDANAARLLLLISGRSSIETAGMHAGKLGIMAAGTAASYGAGYGRAIESGDSVFVYNVYLPSSTGGTILDAVLVDAATGEVLWVNRGLYPPLDRDRSDRLAAIVADLLTGLPVGLTDTGGSS